MAYSSAFMRGAGVTLGLIVAIGAQNAFVIRQCLTKRYVLLTATICTLIDAILITLGINGIGYSIQARPFLLTFFKWGGIVFLVSYGLWSLKAAFKTSNKLSMKTQANMMTWSTVALNLLAVSLLNPHMYLDTMFLIGSIGAQHTGFERSLFNIGAICASCLWFFSLSFGCKRLSHWFSNPSVWQLLNLVIAFIMFGVALSLCYSL